ncbi:MAG: RloB domain-containing protein [Desulfobulbaceae bacterium]|nr:RloB domain-containing protein [Desulfobulbaceae bacterium]
MAGGDKLFHKRRARKLEDHKRQVAKRDPYDKVLIVCEGERTEPWYFRELFNHLRLNTANVRITNNTAGSAPQTVAKFAIAVYRKDKEYDKVFCVIDRDTHPRFREALDIIRRVQLTKGHTIQAVASTPCFEYWLLLHFRKTTKNYYSGPGSACQRVISDLKKQPGMDDYEKGSNEIFNLTSARLDQAITYSKSILADREAAGTDNPSTKVHELVEYLQNLKLNGNN